LSAIDAEEMVYGMHAKGKGEKENEQRFFSERKRDSFYGKDRKKGHLPF